MDKLIYTINDAKDVVSPALIYNKDLIIENIKKAIDIAGYPDRLWAHVKSHKTIEMVKLQIDYGIVRFKCATIAEAEMVAMAGGKHIIVAYPLVGPNIKRFLNLILNYPDSKFYAIGDDATQINILSSEAQDLELVVNFLIDINVGMNRTGIIIDRTLELCKNLKNIKGINICGLHCYDGNNNNSDFNERFESIRNLDENIKNLKIELSKIGIEIEIIVAGGTPSFPVHAQITDWYLSPGTIFLNDMGYYTLFKDLDFTPAAYILTRVISHPNDGIFTLDLGYKGIAADPKGEKGFLIGYPNAKSISQNEEHWVFEMEEGYEHERPEIGEKLYVIPTHICPTSALYSSILISEKNTIVDEWEVTARNRKLKY